MPCKVLYALSYELSESYIRRSYNIFISWGKATLHHYLVCNIFSKQDGGRCYSRGKTTVFLGLPTHIWSLKGGFLNFGWTFLKFLIFFKNGQILSKFCNKIIKDYPGYLGTKLNFDFSTSSVNLKKFCMQCTIIIQ